MIPIKLTFQAFGPYVEKQEILFNKFSNAGVFLIHGHTGSGKTAILDAISYALYGKSSGGQRGDISAMRCQMADVENATYVEYEFKVRDKIYKFTRTIKIRKKRTGAIEYLITHNAMYLNSEEIFVPFFENPKIKDIEEKACEIIGLNHEQFIQVIILPQGKFEKLLIAKSEEKEEILVTLFNAEKWQEAAEWICNKAKTINREILITKENVTRMLKNENAENIENLTEQRFELINNIEIVNKERSETGIKLSAEKSILELQQEISNQFDERDKTKIELDKITEKETEIKTLMHKVEKGKKALSVSQKYELVDSLYKQLLKTKEDLAREEIVYKNCIINKENIEKSLKELKEKEEYIEGLKIKKIKDEGLREVYMQISQSKIDADRENEKYNFIKSEFNKKQLIYSSSKEELKIYSEKIDYIFNNYSLKLPELKEKTEKLSTIVKKQSEINTTKTELNKIDNALIKLNRELLDNNKILEKQKEEYENKYHEYLDQAAYIMGEVLMEGQECPVCGSIHHPSKATKATKNIDASLVKDLSSALDTLKNKISEIENNILKYETHKTMRTEKISNLTEEINIIMESTNVTNCEMLDDTAYNLIKTILEKAEEENKKIDKLKIEEKKLKTQVNTLEKMITELNIELVEQSQKKEETTAKFNSLSNRKIKEINDETGLNNEIKTISVEIEKYNNKINELNKENTKADKDQSSSKTSLEYLTNDKEKKINEFESMKIEYTELLKINEFADTKEFKLYLTDSKLIEQWESTIQKYIIEKESVKKNIINLEKKLENKIRPNIEELKTNVLVLEKKKSDCDKQIVLYNSKIENLTKVIKNVNQEQSKLMKLMKKYDDYYNFGTTLRGDKGVSLRRYVLGVMLSSVTVEANNLLKKVHDGRYQLCRTSEGSGRTRKSGLELEVFDAYSGEKRGVAGLSGGEKFLVSLSLSLGLSAVVQAQSGGIRIDTMFIDEGFGSLDSSSISDAMNILSSVKGSKRLVGIISHVQMLKETIETSIEVKKDRNGSKIVINN